MHQASLQPQTNASGGASGGGSFWEKDFKLFADSMTTTVSTDVTESANPLAALPPGTLTPSPSLHTPSPGVVGQHTPSPSLQAATPPPAATPQSQIDKLETAREMLWARYLESTLQ